MNSIDVVFDAFAFFAYINNEKGADLVEELLKKSLRKKTAVFLHRINWGEIYYKTFKVKGKPAAEEIVEKIRELSILVSDEFSPRFIKQTAIIKGKHPISYADAFAVNLAINNKIPLVTGDPEIKALSAQNKKLNLLWV